MTTIYDVRRENLTKVLAERGAKTALAAKLGFTQSFVSHLLRDPSHRFARKIHEDMARAIEQALLLPPGQLDRDPEMDEQAVIQFRANAIERITELAAHMKVELTTYQKMQVAELCVDAKTVEAGFIKQLLRWGVVR